MPSDLVILVAEDSLDEAELLLHGFRRAGLPAPPHICRDGREIVAYLNGEERFADRAVYPFPQLLLTDLKLPHMSGVQLLRWIRAESPAHGLPVAIFTSFATPEAVAELYRAGANACLRKPMNMAELEDVLKVIHTFWSTCETPPRGLVKGL